MTPALGWTLLVLSGITDVAWAVATKRSNGFTDIAWSAISLVLLARYSSACWRKRWWFFRLAQHMPYGPA